jgi:membrane protein
MRERLIEFFRYEDSFKSSHMVRAVSIIGRTIRRTFEEFFANECFQRASALAFATLLALVPVAAISFFFIARLEAFSEVEAKISDFIFRNFVPARTDEVQRYLLEYTQNVKVIRFFGFLALIITAIFLFNTVEVTFNTIWHVKKKRPFFGKLTSLWTVLTFTPILICTSFLVAAKLAAQGDGFVPAWIVPYVLNIFAFWFVYQFIPYTKVRKRAAVIAAVVAGVLWEIAKGGFSWYIGNLATFSQIYGSLGTVPVFLLWLYLTWVIVLLGTELAYAIQYPHGEKVLAHEYLEFYSVRAMAEITRLFGRRGESKKNTMDALKEIGIPPDILGDILNRLTGKNLLILSEDMEVYPARDPSTITVREVIEAASGCKLLAPPDEKDPISQSLKRNFQQAGKQMNNTLDGMSLQMLVNGFKEETEALEDVVERGSKRI